MTRRDIMCEPGAECIARRSTQGTGRHLKARWTELEIWYRHQANGRPPFVTVVVGGSSIIGEEQRETVQEAATLRIAGTHFMRDALPAIAVREAAAAWVADNLDADARTYTEAQRDAAVQALREYSDMHRLGAVTRGDVVDAVAFQLGLKLEPARG